MDGCEFNVIYQVMIFTLEVQKTTLTQVFYLPISELLIQLATSHILFFFVLFHCLGRIDS